MMETIGIALLSGGFASVIVTFLAKVWIESRVKASIEHEYQKQFALFQRELDHKQKVELVADLLAEYMKVPHGEIMPREQRTQLNKLSFQATLWLPAELAIELSKRLQNQSGAKSPFELILVARRLLTDDTSLSLEHVTFWNPTLEQRGDPVLYRDTR